MERDFLGLTSKTGASTAKLDDDLNVRGSSSAMQWSFSSNKVSAVPQFLSFKASQEDKTTRKNINNLDPIASTISTTTAVAATTIDAYESNHFKPIFKRSVSMGTEAGNKDGMGVVYSVHSSSGPQEARIFSVSSNNQSNLQRSSSNIVLQSNVVLCGGSHNLVNNSANIKPQVSLGHAHGGLSYPSLLPSKDSNNIVGTTDLRNSSKSSAKPAQLTIFYAGSVCVYEDISPEKAQAIMLLAGNGTSSSPIQSKAVSSPNTTNTTTKSSSKDDAFIISQSYPSPLPPSPLPMTFHAASNSRGGGGSSCNINNNELAIMRPPVVSSSSSAPNNNSHNLESPNVVASAKSAPPKMAPPPVGLPQARKVSLARFLEKRKERVTNTSPYYMSARNHRQKAASVQDQMVSVSPSIPLLPVPYQL